uniref:UBN2 domain-containing protein n=1 Tax=Manihot esculenta TaxID=3983 RepID=A0A2C9W5D4_MANES
MDLTYESTNQVKELKANLLVRDFELFEMKPGKNIAEMSTRFTNLVNLLKALGKSFKEAELVKKILRSLLKSWETKTIVIFYTKDFTRYTYDELIGSLIAHKIILKKEIIKKEKGKKSISLK